MSIHRVTLDLYIDDEALADHVAKHGGERPPYTKDLSDWDARDFFDAADLEIVEAGDSSVHWYEGVQPEPSV